LAAIGGDITSSEVKGSNEGTRYSSETREVRPFYNGQASFIGKVGKRLEWGADGRTWSSNSEATWVYTISPSGGPGPSRPPLGGRGNLYSFDEYGTRMRLRARWTFSRGELGASGGTYYRKTTKTPSPLSDASSFNLFRTNLFLTNATGDTLRLPDDVLSSHNEERDWEAAGGVGLKCGRKGTFGAEYHFTQQRLNALTGSGAYAEEVLGLPQLLSQTQRVTWEARSGFEYSVTPAMTGRVGYIFRSEDLDKYTAANEYLSNTATFGLGLRPPGAEWGVETGYSLELGHADFGTPARPRYSRQEIAMQVRWDF
jgi:hypothetical protein